VSPIFVRPVREQLEHDRLIRHLQTKYTKKFEVAVNVGEEQAVPVKIGMATFFPDLVLTTDKKLAGLVEVETGESVNNLEAMAQWVHFARARVPFHLYVPVQAYDAARRFCESHQARVAEIWTYRPVMDGFDLVRLHSDAGAVPSTRPAGARPPAGRPAKPAAPARPAPPARPVATAKPAKAKPSRSPAPKPRKKPAARPSRSTSRPAARAKRR
jgi:hypothetical protein